MVNTDDSQGKGIHWVTYYFPKGEHAEFFDSLGSHPTRYGMEEYLVDHGPSYLYNTKRLQGGNTCGQFCIYYAMHRCRGCSMQDIVNQFTDNLQDNDRKVIHAVSFV